MQESVAFIGAGNVAWHLAPALENIGYGVLEVYSRSPAKGKALVKKLYNAHYLPLEEVNNSKADLIFLTVPDDNIIELANYLELPPGRIIIHTSGAKSLEPLSELYENCGVYYPLQTFSKDKKIDFRNIPILVEGSNRYTEKLLLKMAKELSKKPHKISSEDRKYVHLAAVFACNFTNHMFSVSNDILKEKGLDISLLHPLIVETINKALELNPRQAQTGPAKRHDLKTLDAHMALIENNPELSELYRIISQHIIDDNS